MPGKILGLDINEDYITAVQLVSGFKGFRVTGCAHVPVDNGSGIEGALDSISDKIDLKNDICVSCLQSHHLSFRNLKMPFKDKKKISQTLPFELETLGAFQADDIIIDFFVRALPDRNEILAVSVEKEHLSNYLSKLNESGFNPDILDVRGVPTISRLLRHDGMPESGIFLDIGLKCSTLVLYVDKRIALIRSLSMDISPFSSEPTQEKTESLLRSLSSSVSHTIHSFAWQNTIDLNPEKIFYTGILAQYPFAGGILTQSLGPPAEQVNLSNDKKIQMEAEVSGIWNPVLMDNALALALRDSRETSGFNLRKDDFEIRKRRQGIKKEVKKIAVYFFIVLLLLIIDMGIDFHFMRGRYNFLMQKKTELFRQTFPDTERIVDPVHQMRMKINELKGEKNLIPGIDAEPKILDLLNDISRRVSSSHDILVNGMIIDQESVRISGETDSFNTVDSIKVELEPSDYFSDVIISSAKLDRDGEKVQFEMKLSRVR
ncbi:MAG: hypothetical protein JW882_12930 [Deltaproteobacteria bacterium]|nr:hypothetical protein [Deltaproteobacteria bacterium]